jgi:hypothetical protein
LGELLVSLTYHPAKNTLTIVILKAKNLKAKDINGKSGNHENGLKLSDRHKNRERGKIDEKVFFQKLFVCHIRLYLF